jgi:hypothetical protein
MANCELGYLVRQIIIKRNFCRVQSDGFISTMTLWKSQLCIYNFLVWGHIQSNHIVVVVVQMIITDKQVVLQMLLQMLADGILYWQSRISIELTIRNAIAS